MDGWLARSLKVTGGFVSDGRKNARAGGQTHETPRSNMKEGALRLFADGAQKGFVVELLHPAHCHKKLGMLTKALLHPEAV